MVTSTKLLKRGGEGGRSLRLAVSTSTLSPALTTLLRYSLGVEELTTTDHRCPPPSPPSPCSTTRNCDLSLDFLPRSVLRLVLEERPIDGRGLKSEWPDWKASQWCLGLFQRYFKILLRDFITGRIKNWRALVLVGLSQVDLSRVRMHAKP